MCLHKRVRSVHSLDGGTATLRGMKMAEMLSGSRKAVPLARSRADVMGRLQGRMSRAALAESLNAVRSARSRALATELSSAIQYRLFHSKSKRPANPLTYTHKLAKKTKSSLPPPWAS